MGGREGEGEDPQAGEWSVDDVGAARQNPFYTREMCRLIKFPGVGTLFPLSCICK